MKVDVRELGVLVMKDCKGDAFARVGKVWGAEDNVLPETEIAEILLV